MVNTVLTVTMTDWLASIDEGYGLRKPKHKSDKYT